jgi:hypothetical protein
MFGNISGLWQETQAQYFRETGKQNSGLQWTSALIQQIWQVAWGQWEHRNAILRNSNNLVTQTESVMITSWIQMELETGIQGLLQGDRYLFDDRQVAKSSKWTVDYQVSWLDTEPSMQLKMDCSIRMLSFHYGTFHLITNGTVYVIFKHLIQQSITKTALMDCSISRIMERSKKINPKTLLSYPV